MKKKAYSIFGAGAAGLYTAWRLLSGELKNPKSEKYKDKQLQDGDVLQLFDWGKYDFSKEHPGSRAAGARVCTWHHQNDPEASYLELGGMRYSYWDGSANGGGHRLVTTVIEELGLDKYSVPFNESLYPLYFLRAKNFYLNQITSQNPAPYNADNYAAATPPDNGFTTIQDLAVTPKKAAKMTRKDWCRFYREGKIEYDTSDASVFKNGDPLRGIGYWDLMIDQLGGEGFGYTADGNGYTSNVINWNTAVAIQANNEFTPGTEYRTLSTGYSSLFTALFDAVVKLARKKKVQLEYHPNTRLHSLLEIDGEVRFELATRENPDKPAAAGTTDAAWLAMPRAAVERVALATRFVAHPGLDLLNHRRVQLYLQSAILQPSYKVGMFFDQQWWLSTSGDYVPNYPPQIEGWEVTSDVLKALAKGGFPKKYLEDMKNDANVLETQYYASDAFLAAVVQAVRHNLSYQEQQELLAAAVRNTIGPTVTDLPIRQVVYFGNNARDQSRPPVYGILASYDDETYTTFWQELELEPDQDRVIPLSEDYQPLDGPRKVPERMVKMLRQQLAQIHFGPQAAYNSVPKPIESAFMDWSLPPFNAGYHAYAPHYDVCDVQQKIRKPSQLIDGADAPVYIVGETYSNDQAWVEGAFCTAESVLNDFFGVAPIIDDQNYPFICPCPDC